MIAPSVNAGLVAICAEVSRRSRWLRIVIGRLKRTTALVVEVPFDGLDKEEGEDSVAEFWRQCGE